MSTKNRKTVSRQTIIRDDSLSYVFSQVGTALLSREEERSLGERIWIARRRLASLLRRRRGRTSLEKLRAHEEPLSKEDVKRLLGAERAARNLAGVEEPLHRAVMAQLDEIDRAKDALVRHNLRLVAWVAKRFLGRGLDLLDLFQEGAISLVEAAERFDPARGTRLSTYATRAIQLGIGRALAEKGRMVRIPVHRATEVIGAATARKQLLSTLGREPSGEEVAALSGLDPEAFAELAPALRPLVSTDAAVPGTEIAYGDTLADHRQSPFERAQSREATELAQKALDALPSRQRRILKLRYGIGTWDEQSFESIGRTVGLSRERSRQLERDAMLKLKESFRQKAG